MSGRSVILWTLAVLVLIAGCASQHPVNCDEHLVPINAPHPKSSSAPEIPK